ncbi:E3 SUMO-protein ligase KIAA1586-like [Penaeus indicus]|uniref:E3 SUMO-protein ligase KIAA1586-like n=1 Tax=Penaeus indicus TaxID=29960 RepID=UPI00300C4A52
MVCFLAEHNLPFSIADHMVELFKAMFPDSAIARELHMKKTKCTKLMGNCITKALVAKLQKEKFSVITDESTDVSTTKCMTVVVNFFDSEQYVIRNSTLQLIDIYDESQGYVDSSGESLYHLIIATLSAHGIPLKIFVRFAADGASNIMGENNSISSRLRENFPGITIFKCICHSLHLCASEAVKSLPRHCEDLIRNIYTHFTHSAKRKHEFKKAQEFLELKPHNNGRP